jgi:membrane protein required for colicin V production
MFWYDLVMLVVLGFATVRGAAKGFVWQVAMIAGLVLCFVFAESLSPLIAPLLGDVKPPLNRWIAMFILYLGFSFLTYWVARQLRAWIEKARFVEYDRHLGALFGFVKGVTFCLVITFFVVTLSPATRERVLYSYSGYAAAVIMSRLHSVMPVELHDVLEPYIHQLDRPGIGLDPSKHHDEVIHNEDNATHNEDESAGNNHDPAATDKNTLSELADAFLGVVKWKDGNPPEPESGDSQPKQSDLLQEIAAVYSDFPDDRKVMIEEIEISLSGIPDRVALAVLSDWRADLLDLDPDPDPATDFATPLDIRIVQQLSNARVPLATLSGSLQDRLRESMPR